MVATARSGREVRGAEAIYAGYVVHCPLGGYVWQAIHYLHGLRDAGLELSGYCRGGMFTADAAHRTEARDDNRRAVDEARALGAPCIVLVVGGLPQYSRPGSAASKDIGGARAQVHDAIAEMMDYARTAKMPLAIEPLHPA